MRRDLDLISEVMRKNLLFVLFVGVAAISCTKDPPLTFINNNRINAALSSASGISQNVASFTINVQNSSSVSLTGRGICLSTTNSNPDISTSRYEKGAGINSFSIQIAGLVPATKYYTRAYLITAYDVVYSDVVIFTTLGYNLATVSSGSFSAIALRTASVDYTITAAGGGAISQRGTCWNTTGTPTISNTRTTEGTGVGSFTSQLSGLLPNTLYYVRSYATNQAGTAYGSVQQFRTLDFSLASLGTLSVSSVSKIGAIASSSISSDGGDTIIEKGFCWATTSSPTIVNSRVNLGSGTTSFSYQFTGLTTVTTYYVRAYAINSKGVSYSSQVSFKTL